MSIFSCFIYTLLYQKMFPDRVKLFEVALLKDISFELEKKVSRLKVKKYVLIPPMETHKKYAEKKKRRAKEGKNI